MQYTHLLNHIQTWTCCGGRSSSVWTNSKAVANIALHKPWASLALQHNLVVEFVLAKKTYYENGKCLSSRSLKIVTVSKYQIILLKLATHKMAYWFMYYTGKGNLDGITLIENVEINVMHTPEKHLKKLYFFYYKLGLILKTKMKKYISSGILSQFGRVTLNILMSSAGLSCELVSTMPILLRTPMPWHTRPKIECFPSSHWVGARVRKNWLPLVSGPAFAMARIPAPSPKISIRRSSDNNNPVTYNILPITIKKKKSTPCLHAAAF